MSKFNHNGFRFLGPFLQETYSSTKNENAWLMILVVRYSFLTVHLTHAVL